MQNAVDIHKELLQNWSSAIGYFGEYKQTNILSTTISIRLVSTPLRVSDIEKTLYVSEEYILNENSNFFIIGSPGSGKTVLLKRLIKRILSNGNIIPFLIRARELSDKNIWIYLSDLIGLGLENDKNIKDKIISVINENKLLIFIDGLDEIGKNKSEIINNLEKLYNEITSGKLITTCRTSAVEQTFNNCKVMELAPLNMEQIRSYSELMFGNNKFFETIKESRFFDAVLSPLTLSLMGAIFSRYGALPQKPVALYRRILNLQLEDWDAMRGITRVSEIESFSNENKFFILSFIAFELFNSYYTYSFTKIELKAIYNKLLEILPFSNVKLNEFINEIVSSTGIITQDGYDSFSFTHLSIQEYLAAEYIVKKPFLKARENLQKMPNVLALVVVISSSPIESFTYILEESNMDKTISNQFEVFFNRLIIESDKNDIHRYLEILKSKMEQNKYEPNLLEKMNNVIKTAYNTL